MAEKKINIDTQMLKSAIYNHGLTDAGFGRSIGRSDSYIGNIISRGWVVEGQLKFICNQLGIQIDDIIIKPEEPKEVVAPIIEPPTIDTSKLQEMILEGFKDLNKRLDALETRMLDVAKSESAPELLNDSEKAVLLLKQMALYNARIEEIDYIKKCNEHGINAYTRNMAIKKLDGDVEKLGYGNNAKRVIILNKR